MGCRSTAAQSRAETTTEEFLRTLQQAQEKSAANDWGNAIAAWEKVVQLNPVTGEYWYELAEARYKNKDYRGALPAYEQSLRFGFALPSSRVRDMARCHAMLGDKEQALTILERAFTLGYRRLELIRNDPAFQSLRNEARFQKLVAVVDTSKMSREEGWRYDLQLLAREVKRLRYQPFRSISEMDFDAAVKKIHEAIPRLTDMQITIEMLRLLARVRDGHTTIYAMFERPELRRNLPIDFAFFAEGLFITAAEARYENLLGARVLKFGERSVDEVLSAIETTAQRDNERAGLVVGPMRMRTLPFLHGLSLIPDAEQVALTIADQQGNTRVVTLKADSEIPSRKLWDGLPPNWKHFAQTLTAPLPLYLKKQYDHYWFELLPEAKTVYCQFNRVRDNPQESLAAFSDRLFKFIHESAVEKLVLDMRWNNGGDTGLVLPLLHGLIRNDKINQRGKLFVIIGRRNYSAAQNTATYIERHTKAIFVGEPTGSSPNFIGEDNDFELPYSKLMANVSDLYWQSSMPDDHRPWIAPLLYTPPTFAALRANRDPALEAILAWRN
jgi:hypothetical protein